jgi:hypothetical protein
VFEIASYEAGDDGVRIVERIEVVEAPAAR